MAVSSRGCSLSLCRADWSSRSSQAGYTRSVLRPALLIRGVTNVVVIAAALGAEPGVAMLRTPIKRRGDVGYGLANLGPAHSARVNAGVAEPVAVTTMDALVAALALPRVDFCESGYRGVSRQRWSPVPVPRWRGFVRHYYLNMTRHFLTVPDPVTRRSGPSL